MRLLLASPFRAIFPSRSLKCLQTRSFTSAPASLLRSTELTTSNFSSLRANSSRLWSDIHSTASFGPGFCYGTESHQTGLSRLALSPSDKKVRDWFVQTTSNLGCEIQIDRIGNIFAVRPGLHNDVPATFVGSHLDSQPNGGRFDGVLGVCAGVEMLRVLNENWIETEGPVGVVNWTNEEGARWKRSLMGSGVWAGVRGLNETLNLVDDEGISVNDALEGIGYIGDMGVGKDGVKLAGHFELHIEQGKMLERNKEKVAVVDGVQAYKWFTIVIRGREAHAGATAWEDRSDALFFCAHLMHKFTRMARATGGLVTVGVLRVDNGSVNTVAGRVLMTLDVRHENDQALNDLVCEFRQYTDRAASSPNSASDLGQDFEVELWQEDFDSQAVKFDETAKQCIEESGKSVMGLTEGIRRITSGAGHDSVNTNTRCPTGMIFVPCKNGVTHNPEEWCEEEDCAIGTSVLTESVLRFDLWRHAQGHFGAETEVLKSHPDHTTP